MIFIRRYFVPVGLALLFILQQFKVLQLPIVDSLEQVMYDQYLAFNMPHQQNSQIVIADIDEKSIQQLGQWPWRRDVLAQMLDTLFDHYQVQVVGFDSIFSEPSEQTSLEVLELLNNSELSQQPLFQTAYQTLTPQLNFDQQFTDSLEHRKVVLGLIFEQNGNAAQNPLPLPIGQLDKQDIKNTDIPSATSYVSNLAQFHQVSSYAGFFDNPHVDSDGVFRKVPALRQIQGYLYPSLALEVARVASDADAYQLNFTQVGEHKKLTSIEFADKKIATFDATDIYVPYLGKQQSFQYLSIIDILQQNIAPQVLNNKIVLVGSSAAGLLDLRTTPFSNVYPGVEVHANLVAGILEQRLLNPMTAPLSVALFTLVLLVLMFWLVNRVSDPKIQLVVLSLAVLFVLTIGQVFWAQGYYLPMASPALFIVLATGYLIVYRMLTEAKDRKRLSSKFGQYVPPELVSKMTQTPDLYQMHSEERTLTVLFSDIRNFTQISENLTPHQLSHWMNLYLTAMSEVIYQHQGTIDKYIGDAIMAFWGAPLEDKNHAPNACKAALAMLERLQTLNKELQAQNLPQVAIGIGINSGKMFVGDMGSKFRIAYTAMGDAVNLASRLEGLTKPYGFNCIISQNTKALLSTEFNSTLLDKVQVKGKQQGVSIYCLTHSAISDALTEVVTSYQNQDWLKTKTLLEQENLPEAFCSMYLERCEHFMQNPPPENWDGTFVLQSK